MPTDPNEVIEVNVASKGGATTEEQPENKAAENSNRPAWLPEKFESPEALAAAYSALEKKQSAAQTAEKKTGLPMMEKAAESAVADTGLDLNKLAEEITATGSVSDESAKALEAKGITKEHLEVYVEGQKARAAKFTSALAEVAGGDENLKTLVEWGRENYSAEDLEAYNAALKSGNVNLAKMAVSDLKSRHAAAVGEPGKRVTDSAALGTAGVKPFGSAQELAAAMRDPRYAKDPAYRKAVMDRVAAGPRFFR